MPCWCCICAGVYTCGVQCMAAVSSESWLHGWITLPTTTKTSMGEVDMSEGLLFLVAVYGTVTKFLFFFWITHVQWSTTWRHTCYLCAPTPVSVWCQITRGWQPHLQVHIALNRRHQTNIQCEEIKKTPLQKLQYLENGVMFLYEIFSDY